MTVPSRLWTVTTAGPSNTGGTTAWERTSQAVDVPAGSYLLVSSYCDWSGVNSQVQTYQATGGSISWTSVQRFSVGNIGEMCVWRGQPSGALTSVKVRVTFSGGQNAYMSLSAFSGASLTQIGNSGQTQGANSPASVQFTPQAADSLIVGFGCTPFGATTVTMASGCTAIDNDAGHMPTDATVWIESRPTTSIAQHQIGTSAPSPARWGFITVELRSADATPGGGGGGELPTASVGVTTSIEHMLPGYPARTQTSATLAGAGNEFVDFQIVIEGPATVTGVTIPTFGPFVQDDTVRAYRVGWVNCTSPSGPDGFTGRAPDPLIPDVDDIVGEKRNAFPFDVPQNEVACIWLDFFIPKNTPAGTYSGTIQVNTGGSPSNVPVSIKVWGFNIPETSTLRTFFQLSYPCLPARHDTSTQDKYDTIRSRYAQMGLDHRISLPGIDTGSSDINRFNAFYGPFLNGTGPNDSKSIGTRLGGAKWTSLQGNAWGNNSTFTNNAVSHGWLSRMINYPTHQNDEPGGIAPWSAVAPEYSRIKGINAGIKNLVTTSLAAATSHGVQNSIDIITPVIDQLYSKSGGDTRSSYNSWLSANSIREIWTYLSCDSWGCGGRDQTGWATYAIDAYDAQGHATGLRARQVGWICYNEKVSGHLYYETCFAYTTGDPWVSQNNYGGNGDGTLFYPGTVNKIGGSSEIPVASMRLKHIRDGHQDYELLKILEGLGDTTGQQIARSMFPTTFQPNPDVPTFVSNRLAIGNKIAQLLGAEPQPGAAPEISSIVPSSGPLAGGTSVTIQGTNFRSGCLVLFGGQTANVKGVSSGALQVLTPKGSQAGVVDVTVTNPDGSTITKVSGYSYGGVLSDVKGPPIEAGWPVNVKKTNALISSVDLPVPATSGTGRLLYVTIAYNTRANQNALPIGVSGLGLTWTSVSAADFLTVNPGHIGAEIFAAWASANITAGDKITVTLGSAVTVDLLVTAYARSGTADGSSNVLNAFGVTALKLDPSGGQSRMNIAWPSAIQGTSGAVVVIADGGGAGGISPQGNTRIDAQNKDFISLASGSLVSASSSGGGGTTNYTQPPANGTTQWTPDAGDTSWVNVKDVGAAGDGTTDDTAAFNAAIATGKKIFVPAQTSSSTYYKITSALALGQSIYGDGSMPRVRLVGQDGTQGKGLFHLYGKTGTSYVIIQGLTIEGDYNGSGTAGDQSHNLDIRNSQYVKVQFDSFKSPYGDNINIGGDGQSASSNIVIQNNSMSGPRRCNVKLESASTVSILSNTMAKAVDYNSCIDIESTASTSDQVSDVTIQGNTLDCGPNWACQALYTDHAPGGSYTITGNTGSGTKSAFFYSNNIAQFTNVTSSPNTWNQQGGGASQDERETPQYIDCTGGGAMPDINSGYVLPAGVALQTGINTATSQGKPLVIDYAITPTVSISSWVNVTCSILGKGAQQPTIRTTANDGTAQQSGILRLASGFHGWIYNLHLLGTWSPGAALTERGHCINVGSVNGVTIKGCFLDSPRGDCIADNIQEDDGGTATNVLIIGNTFRNWSRCMVSLVNVITRWAIMNNTATNQHAWVSTIDAEPWREQSSITYLEVAYNQITTPADQAQTNAGNYVGVLTLSGWYDTTPGHHVWCYENHGQWPFANFVNVASKIGAFSNVTQFNNTKGG